MLNKIQVEEADELDDMIEDLGLVETLVNESPANGTLPTEAKIGPFHPEWSNGEEATGKTLAEGVASPEERAKALRAAGKSYSAIAREVLGATTISSFHVNKVKALLGETGASAKAVQAAGEAPSEKRRGGRRAETPPARAEAPSVGTQATQAKVEPLGVTEEPPKRDSLQKPNDDGAGQALALNGNGGGNGHGDMVSLNLGQFSRLWEIVTGGQVGIEIQNGKVTCLVTESSFKKALPALLDRL